MKKSKRFTCLFIVIVLMLEIFTIFPLTANAATISLNRPLDKAYTITAREYYSSGSYHGAIDYGCPKGTPVYAAESGTVTVHDGGYGDGYSGCKDGNGWGNYIDISHNDGYSTRYAHMSTGRFVVTTGSSVTRGQLIGYSGHSGNSTGAHLHFGLYLNGSKVYPEPYIKTATGYFNEPQNPHTCNNASFAWYEAAHPHYNCYKCSICGTVNRNTSEINHINTCSSCWYAEFDVSASSISLKVGESKTISVTVDGCYPDTAKTYGRLLSGNGVVETQISNNQITFKALKSGTENYEISVYSDSSRSHLIDKTIIPISVGEHTHSYTGNHWEKVHPHRVYQKCSCGATQYVTGKYYTYTDGTCLTCVKPDKPTLLNMKSTYADNESIKFEWSNTSNTTHYNIWIGVKNSQGKWERYDHLTYVTSGVTNKLPIGEYRCCVQSYNSKYWFEDGSDWLYTEGDYCYFNVISSKYTVNYNANGGIGSMEPSNHIRGESKKLSKNTFTKEGYAFIGWSKNPDAIHPEYKDELSVENLATTDSSVVNLYAVWKPWFYGNLNSDNKISVSDLTILTSYINEDNIPNSWQKFIADVNGDGILDEKDTSLMSEYIVGLIDFFPAENMKKHLTIESIPYKTTYYANEKLDTDGLCVTMTYYDSDAKYDLTEYCQINTPDLSTAGFKNVEISFKGYHAKYLIEVSKNEETKSTEPPTSVITEPVENTSATVTTATDPSESSTTPVTTVTEPSESSTAPVTTVTEPSESIPNETTVPTESTFDEITPPTESTTDEVTNPSESSPDEITPPEETYLSGDVNGDGKVNIKDATQIQRATAKIVTLTDTENLCADVTKDKKVNIKDATAIQRYIAKIETDYLIGQILKK